MMMFRRLKLLGLSLLAAALSVQPLSAEAPQLKHSAVIEKLLQQQQDEVSASLRSDVERLQAILALLSNIIERNDLRTAERAMRHVTFALVEMRLPAREKAPVLSTLDCIATALEKGQKIQPCRALYNNSLRMLDSLNTAQTAQALVAKSNQYSIVTNPLERFTGLSSTPATLPPDKLEKRSSYAISFYGQSVDVELGRLLALLARYDPDLLRPIPINKNFQYAKCLNGPFPMYVGLYAKDAAARYQKIMAQSAEPREAENGDVLRFGIWQSSLADRIARAGGNYPAALADYTSDQAFNLLREEFSTRFGLTEFSDDPVVTALMTLWVVRETQFEKIVSNYLQREVTGADIGPALARTGLRGQALWEAVYQSTVRFLHCSDADKVFEAYGLTYRRGDYPTARATLTRLREAVGYPAVPSLKVTTVERRFIEDQKPNCAAFGPVESRYSGNDAKACHLGEIDLGNGQSQYLVLGGGARVEFLVTPAERERLADYMRLIEKADRGGEILRWAAEGAAELDLQTIRSSVALPSWDNNWDKLPCVLGMSYYIDPSDTEQMVEHFKDYRQNFYPVTGRSLNDEKWQLFMIDEFNGFRKPDFAEKLMPLAKRLAGVLATLKGAQEEEVQLKISSTAPEIDLNPGTDVTTDGTVPSLDGVGPDLGLLCDIVERQLSDFKGAQDVSHGAFLESLLFDASSSLADVKGLGLLNDKGPLEPDFISSHYKSYAANKRIDMVANHIGNIVTALKRTASLNNGNEPVTVVNVSMGRSYANQGGAVRDVAKASVKNLKTDLLYGDSALFVVAAGQPTVDPNSVRDARDLEAQKGLRLVQTDPKNLDVNYPDCSFFPACFSGYKNVITVGAVKPSPSGFGKPVIMPWSNYGSAVTLAAPGQGVLGNDLAYLPNDDPYVKLKPMPFSSLRDGTSIATVFVTALAAKIAAENTEMTPAEIKMRLTSTVRPYISSDGDEELLRGVEGQIYAGVIDPKAALRNPSKYHVTYRTPRSDGRLTVEYDIIQRAQTENDTEKRPLWLFDSTSTSESEKLTCNWKRLLRLHFDDETEKDETWFRPIPRGAIVCETGKSVGDLAVGAGSFGTTDVKQNTCLVHDTCFEALSAETGGWMPLKIAEIRDIYFPSGP
ncbi:S8 family serine peptidase [Roseibium sp.]|uniref:S8 family serine peptidase n=1 Tax=Roseibium sp. TaxID=1936156 RepID=UPI003A983B98